MTNLTPGHQQGTNLKQRAASDKKAKEDKENQPKKQSKPVGKSVDIAPNSLDSAVSSAIELVICASTTNKKETKTPNTPPPPPGFQSESSKDVNHLLRRICFIFINFLTLLAVNVCFKKYHTNFI